MRFTRLDNGVLRSADELGINYIENGDAELASPAPSLYSDAADVKPADGQGGSVNTSTELNFSRSTSSPLRGAASWVFDKKSGNQQGKGGSFPFTIDVADKGKQVQITFDYSVLSGTYATGDVAVYIVHDPSGTPKVIQPSAFNIENVGIESLARLTFQTEYSSVLDYNLCFHVASTSASAYSLKFDNIQLGPQVVPLGAPVTDWVSYTPTNGFTGGSNTSTAVWRRVGDQLEVQIFTTFTSVFTGGSASYTIPSGLTIDTSKLPGNGGGLPIVGHAELRDVGTDQHAGIVVYQTTTSVLVRALQDDSGPSSTSIVYSGISTTVPFTWANNDTIFVRFSVPIVGWSSSTVVSSSADTRVVAGSNGKTSAQAITATTYGTAQKVTYNTTPWLDTHGMWDSSNNRWVVKVPGKYRISAPLAYQATTSEVQGLALLRQNTVDIHQAYLTKSASTNSNVAAVTLEAIVDCKAGDYFEVFTYHPVPAGSLDILANTAVSQVRFMIEMLQGPSQIAASEVIAVCAYRSATPQTVPNNTDTTIVFDTVETDTHGSYNASTGVFTAPAPGLYKIDASVRLDLTIGTATATYAYVQKNGSGVRAQTYQYQDLTAADVSLRPTDLVRLNAGDTITVRAAQFSTNSGATSATTFQTYLNIHRLGGVG